MVRLNRFSFTLLVWITSLLAGRAQDSLPKFSLYRLGPDKVLIQWKNPDKSLRQLSIQQSSDSLYRFKTVLTMPDPRIPENGTVISRPGAGNLFYRIYLLYPKGRYVFTFSKFPEAEPPVKKSIPIKQPAPTIPKKDTVTQKQNPVKQETTQLPSTEKKDTVTVALVRPQVGNLPDLTPGQKYEVKKVNTTPAEPERYITSKNVYAHRDGYAFIEIPKDWDLTQVEIRFFSENGQSLFDLKSPAIRTFRVDKTNFYRAGWQTFELWHKGKLVEKNRFYLPLEF